MDVLVIAACLYFICLTEKTFIQTGSILLAITFICGNLLSNYCAAIAYAKRNFFLPNVINIAHKSFIDCYIIFDQIHQTKDY